MDIIISLKEFVIAAATTDFKTAVSSIKIQGPQKLQS
jgi:hypothetical protein